MTDCLSGSVYERVGKGLGYDREKVKKLFFAVIYGWPGHMDTKVGRATKEVYPTVFREIVRYHGEFGHGTLPRVMQTLESRVMIDRVCRRLIRERPDMPILTVHDCIVSPPDDADMVKRIIEEEWWHEFGVTPRLKRWRFTDPQPQR